EESLFNVWIDPETIILDEPGVFVGMRQFSQSKGKAESAEFVIGNATESEATSTVRNQYIDLNGDRYPDIITEGKIQFTNTLGALSYKALSSTFISGDESEDTTYGITIPSMKPNSSESANGKSTGNKTITNTSAGINTSNGKSFNASQWVDMNGDGLPDKVKITDDTIEVQLNIGYGFSNTIIWGSGYSNLIASTRNNLGIGPGITLGGLFALGLGVSASTANIGASFVDVNGDGLPDLVIKSSSALLYTYFLNIGDSFSNNSYTFYNNKIEE